MELNATDYFQIQQTFSAFAAGLDLRDWKLYRSVFTAEIDVDYSSYRAGSVSRMPADDWVNRARRLFPGLDANQHFLSNLHLKPLPALDGTTGSPSSTTDLVQARMYVRAEHALKNDQGDDTFTIGGYYVDRLVRTPQGWKISSVALTVLWNTGNRHILSLAAELVTARDLVAQGARVS